jgi:hypothetical protein
MKKTAVKLGQAELKINYDFMEQPYVENIRPEFIALMELSHRTIDSVRTKMFTVKGRAGDIKNNLINVKKYGQND